MPRVVSLGLEVVLEERLGLLAGRRIGLLCNHAAVNSQFKHVADLLAKVSNLRCLFGPEHGVRGEAQDMIGVGEGRDACLDLPVYSLYGASVDSLRPQTEWLADLDLVLIDLQDIGSRYYTFVWTMALMMQVCAEMGVSVVVLDRPNPIGGEKIEGPLIENGFFSFVGHHSVPIRHGMTIGEMARLVHKELALYGCELQVVPMEGWQRNMYYDQTGLPWVLPSPNMPTLDTALVYPGACLFEGTNLSEGRGTTRPFEILGAPWVDGNVLAEALEKEDLPGVGFRPICFTPTFHKHSGKPCGGIQIHVVAREKFRPLLTGVAILRQVHNLWPKQFEWRKEAYEFVADRPAIDLLAGGAWLRKGIEAGATLEKLTGHWNAAESEFARRRKPYLIYN
ncbi:MAG: DUF1343 domain-containing protein [Pseudomonadota bacterium]